MTQTKPVKLAHEFLISEDGGNVFGDGVFDQLFTYKNSFISPTATRSDRRKGNLPSIKKFLNQGSNVKVNDSHELLDMGSKRSQSVLKESYVDAVLNENPSAAVISLQAKRHSSLGFNEAFEKGDFFIKDGESSIATTVKPKLSFKGSKVDLA